MTFILKKPDETLLEEVAEGIRGGKVCIYPTETCYGLGTNALDKEAVKKIYEIKNRSEEKGLSCIVHSLEQAQKYCELTKVEMEVCEEFMPGPLTLVAEKRKNVPDLLNEKFVFRVSSNRTARTLAKKAEVPLIATSANLSEAQNNYSVSDISRLVKDKVDYIIDLGELEPVESSTVLELRDSDQKIWRKGPISKEQLKIKFPNLKT